MNLKYKNVIIDRRNDTDRRQVNLSLWNNKIERRKRPDRRMGGVDVSVLDLNEDEFNEIFESFLGKRFS